MAIDFYTVDFASAPCRAVAITLKMLKLPYNKKVLDLLVKHETLTPKFIKLNPQHCVPTIVDNGFVLWESQTIMQYLVDEYFPDNALYPKDSKKRAIINRMMDFDLGTLYVALFNWFIPQILTGAEGNSETWKIAEEKMKLFDALISGKQFVAGDHLTLADISAYSTVTTLLAWNYDYTQHPNIDGWLKRMNALIPDYEEVTEKPIKFSVEAMQALKRLNQCK